MSRLNRSMTSLTSQGSLRSKSSSSPSKVVIGGLTAVGDVNVIYDNPLPFFRVLISRGDDGSGSVNVSEEASLFSDKTKDELYKKQLNLDHFQKLTRERARIKQKEINTKKFNDNLKKTKQLSTITTPSVPIVVPSTVKDVKKKNRKETTSTSAASTKSDFVKAMNKASVNLSVLAKRL